jgi:hypothetical protein
MTEQEAAGRWCFAAVASHTNPRQGFDVAVDEPSQGFAGLAPPVFPCIGSRCMAWRWEGVSRVGEQTGLCGLAGPVLS